MTKTRYIVSVGESSAEVRMAPDSARYGLARKSYGKTAMAKSKGIMEGREDKTSHFVSKKHADGRPDTTTGESVPK
jgi:hypothetical protein